MSQTWQAVDTGPGGDTGKNAIIRLLERSDTVRSNWSGTSFPSSPVEGQFCYRTDLDKLYVWDTVTWVQVLTGVVPVSLGGSGGTTAAEARAGFGLGTAAVLDFGVADDNLLKNSAGNARYLQKSSNLSDLESPATARNNLGLGGLSTLNSVGAAQIVDGSVGTAELADLGVTFAKQQNLSAQSRLVGTGTAGGLVQREISLGAGLAMSGNVLSSTSGIVTQNEVVLEDFALSGSDVGIWAFSVGPSQEWYAELLFVLVAAGGTLTISVDAPSLYAMLRVNVGGFGSAISTVRQTTGAAMTSSAAGTGGILVVRHSITAINGPSSGNVFVNVRGTGSIGVGSCFTARLLN